MDRETIVNSALDLVGYPDRIASLWDGSPESIVARDFWDQALDFLLAQLRPDWSVWDDALKWSKQAPPYYDEQQLWTTDYPDIPWKYEYAVPDDCVVPLTLKPRPSYLPIYRPRPMRFRTKSADGVYTILGNDPAPILTCIHRVSDPSLWDPEFTEKMILALAKAFEALYGHPRAQEAQSGRPDNRG